MRPLRLQIVLGAALSALWASVATAAVKPAEAGRAAAAQAISDCRKVPDRDARLACYDKAADAFEEAQAQGQVVVIDRTQARQIKRQAFGFNLPAINLFKAGPAEEKLDRISVTLTGAYRNGEGKWVMSTDEGSVWRQTDDTDPYNLPKAGDHMVVKSAALSSYFCTVGSDVAMRCTRAQ